VLLPRDDAFHQLDDSGYTVGSPPQMDTTGAPHASIDSKHFESATRLRRSPE